MYHDDRPVGRVLSRREVLALFGTTSAAFLAACAPRLPEGEAPTEAIGIAPGPPAANGSVAVPHCVVRPAQAQGPYFVDELLERSDIRADPSDGTVKEGLPLDLVIRLSEIAGAACIPLAGASVDVWHCDAAGVYSNVSDPGFDTVGQRFLRGYQLSDGEGLTRFTTIYPGWYPGRTVHIHFKIRTPPVSGSGYEFVSQLYFDDAVTDEVHMLQPYASRGRRTVRNENDRIFRNGGDQLMLELNRSSEGYSGSFEISLQLA